MWCVRSKLIVRPVGSSCTCKVRQLKGIVYTFRFRLYFVHRLVSLSLSNYLARTLSLSLSHSLYQSPALVCYFSSTFPSLSISHAHTNYSHSFTTPSENPNPHTTIFFSRSSFSFLHIPIWLGSGVVCHFWIMSCHSIELLCLLILPQTDTHTHAHSINMKTKNKITQNQWEQQL